MKLIRLSKSCLGEEEKNAVMGVLDREYLGIGAEVSTFEGLLTDYFKRESTCVVNGTGAIQLAVQACGIGAGDEVLIPSLTYVASFQAISATGAKPVPCDIDPQTLMIDVDDAQKRITKRTKAIVPVHYTGGVGDLDNVYKFATTNGLRVIEDAAHAFGTVYKGKRIGSFGDIVCFSFDGIKNITSGEGGCIVTADNVVSERIKDLRLLGVEKDTEKRYSGKRSWDFDVQMQGWRYHMSNVMAAIGIEQLKKFPLMADKRKRLAMQYDKLLSNHLGIQILPRNYYEVVPHIYVVRIAGLNVERRMLLQDTLSEQGIQTGIHYKPNHELTFYKDDTALPFPITTLIYPELLTLPLHPDLSVEDVEFVCKMLKRTVDER